MLIMEGYCIFSLLIVTLKSSQVVLEEEIKESQKEKDLNNKMHSMIRDVVWHVMLVVLMVWVVTGNQDETAFDQTLDLRNTFSTTMFKVRSQPFLIYVSEKLALKGNYLEYSSIASFACMCVLGYDTSILLDLVKHWRGAPSLLPEEL